MPTDFLHAFWHVTTRLGEAQILLPMALVLALWLAWRGHAQRLAVHWVLGLAVATAVTTASKVAFVGFGWGWPALDFTGVSGHAMFAAAIYPLAGVALAGGVAEPQAASWRRLGLAAGFGLALLVGVSRVVVDVHSWSEVVAGLAVGAAATAAALLAGQVPSARPPLWLPLLVGVWLGVTPSYAPPSKTHDLVTRLSVAISGHGATFERDEMRAVWKRQRAQR